MTAALPTVESATLDPDHPDHALTAALADTLHGLADHHPPADLEATAGTPARWVKALREMTAGYAEDPRSVLARDFNVPHADEMIAVTGIDFTSICAHHLLPFTGTATVAYLPAGPRVVGLSKLARLVDTYSRRLQTQEQITVQVTTALDEHLTTKGSACVLRATHSCLAHRGARKPSAVMVTSSLTGRFRDDARARGEFLALTRP